MGSVLSLIALAFALAARAEREDRSPATRRLTAEMGPDKSLAASLLVLMRAC